MFSEPEITNKRSRYDTIRYIESYKVGENESDHTHTGVFVCDQQCE